MRSQIYWVEVVKKCSFLSRKSTNDKFSNSVELNRTFGGKMFYFVNVLSLELCKNVRNSSRYEKSVKWAFTCKIDIDTAANEPSKVTFNFFCHLIRQMLKCMYNTSWSLFRSLPKLPWSKMVFPAYSFDADADNTISTRKIRSNIKATYLECWA